MDLSFKGQAKRLDNIDLPTLGARIGVGEDELHAFLDAETLGSGFDKMGRPKMLFEPHVFYARTKGADRDKAVKQGLAYKEWKPGSYPADSYPRLLKAMAINETAALESASWGLGQVMGFNHKAAGFAAAQDMVMAFMADEEHHLAAAVNFIKANGLDDELRRHDWDGFARGYNGPGYKRNGYDRKLAEAFAKWSRIKDTPIPQLTPRPVIPPEPPKPAETRPEVQLPPVAPVVRKSLIAEIIALILSLFKRN